MNLEFFIAKRILLGKERKHSFTKPVINIAVAGIALGAIIMLMAVSIAKGFQKEVKQKIIAFASDVQISNSGIDESYESAPLQFNQSFYDSLIAKPNIEHVQTYATKAGIIKTQKTSHGVVAKGISNDFNWKFFNEHIIEGDALTINDTSISKEALISKKIADALELKIGDKFRTFFISQNKNIRAEAFRPKKYAFTVKGIYETGLSDEFDSKFIFIDLKRIQKLNKWNEDTIGGYEIFFEQSALKPLKEINLSNYESYQEKSNFIKENFYLETAFLEVRNIFDRQPQIISWLDYIDTHIYIILIIILVVSIINMSSALLIIILEKTQMIGLLKSFGATNASIRKLFIYKSTFLIGKGLLIGNLISLIFCAIQYNFKLIPMDQSIYYLDAVPIYLNIFYWLGINLLTVLICRIMLIIPSWAISFVKPVKAIKFN